MSDCCSNSCMTKKTHKQHRCPVNGKEYKEISEKTIMHHIKESWNWKGKQQSYYFCDDPSCDVVYFGEDDSVIDKTEVRTLIGIKENTGDALVCYCFGVTVNQATINPGAKEFVIEMTKNHICECEARNPSGKCCLKGFPTE